MSTKTAKKIVIYVATFQDGSGYPFQKVFKDKKKADAWLYRMWEENLGDEHPEESHKERFKEWCNYGGFTGKVKRFTISF